MYLREVFGEDWQYAFITDKKWTSQTHTLCIWYNSSFETIKKIGDMTLKDIKEKHDSIESELAHWKAFYSPYIAIIQHGFHDAPLTLPVEVYEVCENEYVYYVYFPAQTALHNIWEL